ncbi:Uncharacterised protein [Pannonibacter phragmitetus]|uniref:Uncharacterized protein n=1 Tax=Pannonibacter phragmitetus TaxID=121719 RepID=A0A379A2S1_9HYPH|nr:Uncharacterised protein [Pannonibacter phragmitetus]
MVAETTPPFITASPAKNTALQKTKPRRSGAMVLLVKPSTVRR